MALEKTKTERLPSPRPDSSHWLSTLAHDLSGPLFAVRGYTRLALEEKDSPLTESRRRYLTAVLENIDRLVAFAQELNDAPARDAFKFDTISFRTLLQEVAAGIRSSWRKRHPAYRTVAEWSTFKHRRSRKTDRGGARFSPSGCRYYGQGGTIRMQAHEENEKIILRFSSTRVRKFPGSPARRFNALQIVAFTRRRRLRQPRAR